MLLDGLILLGKVSLLTKVVVPDIVILLEEGSLISISDDVKEVVVVTDPELSSDEVLDSKKVEPVVPGAVDD